MINFKYHSYARSFFLCLAIVFIAGTAQAKANSYFGYEEYGGTWSDAEKRGP